MVVLYKTVGCILMQTPPPLHWPLCTVAPPKLPPNLITQAQDSKMLL